MEEQFNEKFNEWLKKKKRFYLPVSNADYQQRIASIVRRNRGETLESVQEMRWANRYIVRKAENGETILYYGEKRMIHRQAVFQVLHDTHLRLKHSGRDMMNRELRSYFGLSKEIILIYLSLCKKCELKGKPKSKAKLLRLLDVNPEKSILPLPPVKDPNSWCQIDIVDMGVRDDNAHRFLIIFRDNRTKFVLLDRMIKSTIDEISQRLIQTFATFGAPNYLCSANGSTFSKQVCAEITRKLSECRIERLRAPMECRNDDVRNALGTWLHDHGTTNWIEALPFVQISLNRRIHLDIGCSPFEKMFSRKMELNNNNGLDQIVEMKKEDDDDKEEFVTIDGSSWIDAVTNVKRDIKIERDDLIYFLSCG